MTFMEIILCLLLLFSLAGIYRLIKGPTVWDRILAFSFYSSKIMVAAILIGVIIGKSFMVDIALIYGILGFIGTIMIARFIKRKGDI